MPDHPFKSRQHDDVPLHRNVAPVLSCETHTTQRNGKSCLAIAVPILTCASVWLRVQKEAEDWIAPGGKLIADPKLRNRRINAAYAQLWLADRRFQWAGLAAFASKQVGCGLLHASRLVDDAAAEIGAFARSGNFDETAMVAANIMPSTVMASAEYMYGQLALGNTALFLDVYPLHRFYMLRGMKSLKDCIESRNSISDRVIWPISHEKLKFGRPFKEIVASFSQVDRGEIRESVISFAQHEQINILQAAIYNDFLMRRALDGNQFSWATGFPSGVANAIELTLSAQCMAMAGGQTVSFSKLKFAKLYDQDQRMVFVKSAAKRFDEMLLGGDNFFVEKSIEAIAADGEIS